MERYNFKIVENKWQKYWEENKTFKSTGGLRIAVEESSSLGEDGWELVTINYCNDYREWVFTYKRPQE